MSNARELAPISWHAVPPEQEEMLARRAEQQRIYLQGMGIVLDGRQIPLAEPELAKTVSPCVPCNNDGHDDKAAQQREMLRRVGIDFSLDHAVREGSVAAPRHFNSLQPVRVRSELLSSARRVASGIGWAAVGACVVVGSLFGAASILDDDTPSATAEVKPPSPAMESKKQELDTAATPPVTEAPAPVMFEASPDERIGTLSIPAICEEIEVYAFSEQEKIDDLVGKGQALVDRLVRDETPTEYCEIADQREAEIEAQNGPIKRRNEWQRASATTSENPSGDVDYWQPIAGHEQRADGGYTSVFPGQIGNTVLAGHRSTYNAAFGDISLLKEGDRATFLRDDGKVLPYTMVEAEILPGDDDTPIRLYTHPDSPSTMTLYACSDENGRAGSDIARYTVRFVLDTDE